MKFAITVLLLAFSILAAAEPVSFPIAIEDPGTLERARLVMGIHRGGGVTEALVVEVNGKVLTVDTGDASEFSEFFGPLDAPLLLAILKEINTVEIQAQKGTTITSVQIVSHRAGSPVVPQESEVPRGK